MTEHRIGVAISTTGDLHRLQLLAKSVKGWQAAGVDRLFVTVDGEASAVTRVAAAIRGPVLWVGEPHIGSHHMSRDGRLGVAVNKNTGIEALMGTDVEHLFLSDDDAWPLTPESLELHTDTELAHSMVNWGGHRLGPKGWTWPRGSVLYAGREVVEQVGGMVEAFGPGGHEHVEWSRRIHQHGITHTFYPTPFAYLLQNGMGAREFWHAEDMPRQNEGRATLMSRRRRLTSVRRLPGDYVHIERIMAEMEGKTDFVPYDARENGRDSATLYQN